MAIDTDELFVSVTRPAMIKGVTLGALFCNMIFTSIIFLAFNNILYLLSFIPIHIVLYLMTRKDPYRFEMLMLWSTTKGRNLNKNIWKSSSYGAFVPYDRDQKK